jgi:protein ImuA
MSSCDQALLDGLRDRMRALEGGGRSMGPAAVPLAPAIDAHLPWGGLPRGALNEVRTADAGPATLFAVAALRAVTGTVVWIRRGAALDAGAPCPAGLVARGLDPRRVILVAARNDTDALWAMEESLRARVAVLAELGAADQTATRRLALAAETGQSLALLLLPDTIRPTPSAAATRWRIAAAPSREGRVQFRAELFRCRGAAPASWLMEESDETHRLAVATALHDRTPDPHPARLAG